MYNKIECIRGRYKMSSSAVNIYEAAQNGVFEIFKKFIDDDSKKYSDIECMIIIFNITTRMMADLSWPRVNLYDLNQSTDVKLFELYRDIYVRPNDVESMPGTIKAISTKSLDINNVSNALMDMYNKIYVIKQSLYQPSGDIYNQMVESTPINTITLVYLAVAEKVCINIADFTTTAKRALPERPPNITIEGVNMRYFMDNVLSYIESAAKSLNKKLSTELLGKVKK